MLIIVGITVLILIVALLAYAATKPDSFRIQRSLLINAPPEKIYPLINDLQSWRIWSPYEKKDLAMKRTFSADTKGKGAT